MAESLTNKLSIYLIKQKYSSLEDILKDHENLTSENIDDVGEFFYGDSNVFSPSWVQKFFDSSFDNKGDDEKLKIFTASSKAVFIVTVERRKFVLSFGYGHTLLTPGVCEERFGLKVALNIVDSENLRSIDKKNMSITPKLSKEQMTKSGNFTNFGIDIEQDLIQGITGKSKDENFGKTVTGKDSLTISVKKDISNITDFLKDCLQKYKSDDYKKNFNWIDHISEMKDPKAIEELDDELIEKIKNEEFDKTWMAIPDIVEWENVSEFKFKQNSFGNDIDLPTYLEFLTEKEKQNLSLNTFKNKVVNCISADTENITRSWKIYDCLCSEIESNGQTNVLSNGKWYQIDSDFARTVSNSFESIRDRPTQISLPPYNQGEREEVYNQRAAEECSGMFNMDKKLIHHGGSKQKIEFCDLLTKDKELIHVKRYGTSSVLSHLFSQGLVSGELLLSDSEFRKKLNKKLPVECRLVNSSGRPDPENYKIIFAIISNAEDDLDIPFFSKVNIRNAVKRLETFGYSVSLLKISTNIAESN